jgi:hypothetical protein
MLLTLHIHPNPDLVAVRKLTCPHSEGRSHVYMQCIFTKKYTSIFSERKAVDARLACRVNLHLATSLLTQYDSFSEKLTFIQNSLLFLYIDKKMKNWKTASLFFLAFFWQSLFLSQPGRKYQSFSLKSCLCWCCPFFSISPGS